MMKESTDNANKIERPYLSKKVRWMVWATMWFTLINVTLSSGIMSSGAKTIKAQLCMMDLEYGCFSAMYAIGRMIGSLLFVSLINAVNRKYLILIAVFFKGVTVAIFYFSIDGYILLGIRLISGICHIFPVIYGPIWVDQLCVQKHRYFMMSGLSICGPFGRSLGFIADYALGSDAWRKGFVVNGLCLIGASFVFLFYPNIYFSSKLFAMTGKEGQELLRPSQARAVSLFNVRESEVDERDINFLRKYWIIFSNPVYVFCLFARVVINSITSILQFWIPNYLTEVIGYGNREVKLGVYVFMICCLPFAGSFFGSYAAKSVGGYSNRHSLVIVLIFNMVSCILFAPMPFMNTWYGFLGSCAAFQLCGSAVLPTLNGIILSSIPAKLKAKGYAIANVAGLLFGSVPSPIVYGLLNDKFKTVDKRFSMKYFTCYSFLSLLWIFIATIFRYRADDKGAKQEPFKQDKQEEDHIKVSGMTGENYDLDVPMIVHKENADDEAGIQLQEHK